MNKSIFIVLFVALFFNSCFGIGENLDFEIHSCNASACIIPAGDTSLTDWNIERDITLVTKSLWKAASENASISLQTTNGSGSISQYITTKVGQEYKIKFKLAGSQASATYTLELLVGGSNASNFNYSSQWLKGWQERSFSFVATGETTLVRFSSLNTGPNGPAIDDIEIGEVKPDEEEKELNSDVQIGIVVVAVVLVGGGALLKSL